jgi:hypothetical protein
MYDILTGNFAKGADFFQKNKRVILIRYIGALLYLIFIDRAAVFGIRHNVIPLYSLYLSFKTNDFYEVICTETSLESSANPANKTFTVI